MARTAGHREKRTRWTPEQAKVVLAELERSGLPLRTFAARRGIDAERLYRWRTRFSGGGVRSVARVASPGRHRCRSSPKRPSSSRRLARAGERAQTAEGQKGERVGLWWNRRSRCPHASAVPRAPGWRSVGIRGGRWRNAARPPDRRGPSAISPGRPRVARASNTAVDLPWNLSTIGQPHQRVVRADRPRRGRSPFEPV